MNERAKVYPALIWPCFFASVYFGSPKSGAKYLLDRQVYCLLHRQISNSRKKFMAYGFPRILSLIPCWELFFFFTQCFLFILGIEIAINNLRTSLVRGFFREPFPTINLRGSSLSFELLELEMCMLMVGGALNILFPLYGLRIGRPQRGFWGIHL